MMYCSVILFWVHWECPCVGREVNILKWELNEGGEDAYDLLTPLFVKGLIPFKSSLLSSFINHVDNDGHSDESGYIALELLHVIYKSTLAEWLLLWSREIVIKENWY